jgi:hypothetical protein
METVASLTTRQIYNFFFNYTFFIDKKIDTAGEKKEFKYE